MQLDVRTPIGLIFVLVGAILAAYGAATSGSPIYGRSLGINLNLWWGIALFVFGGVMLLLARKGRKA